MTIDELAARDTNPGFRVWVDGTQHPIHDHPSGLVARLLLATGEVAEVQVIRNGPDLVVVIGGEVEVGRDPRGNTRVMVYPVKPTA